MLVIFRVCSSTGRLLSAWLSIGLWLSVFTLPTRQQETAGQRDFSLVDAYASNNKKSPLFVQQLDHHSGGPSLHSSSLFYSPSPPSSSSSLSHLHRPQEPDGAETLFSSENHDEGDEARSHGEERLNEDEKILDDIEYNNGFPQHHERKAHNGNDQQKQRHQQQQSQDNYRGDLGGEGDGDTTLSRDGEASETDEDSIPPGRVLLTRRLIKNACHRDRGLERVVKDLNDTYLTHCHRYKLGNLLSNEIFNLIRTDNCERILEEFVQLDETINQFDSLFIKLLSRYNCHNGYSVKWNCDDCKKAYKDWLCATHLPFYMDGERIKPCISFCERVEQRCPYLHPITREQYGGQPVFICRDPNIPFVPEITPDIPYSEPGLCYDLCHLSDNLTELTTDSLSKYDFDKCPNRDSIAEQVLQSEQKRLAKNSKLPSMSGIDDADYTHMDSPDEGDEGEPRPHPSFGAPNRTSDGRTKVLLVPGLAEHGGRELVHVHNKKLDELREVLANYKNQAKTHRYHADHSSIDHAKSQSELTHSS